MTITAVLAACSRFAPAAASKRETSSPRQPLSSLGRPSPPLRPHPDRQIAMFLSNQLSAPAVSRPSSTFRLPASHVTKSVVSLPQLKFPFPPSRALCLGIPAPSPISTPSVSTPSTSTSNATSATTWAGGRSRAEGATRPCVASPKQRKTSWTWASRNSKSSKASTSSSLAPAERRGTRKRGRSRWNKKKQKCAESWARPRLPSFSETNSKAESGSRAPVAAVGQSASASSLWPG